MLSKKQIFLWMSLGVLSVSSYATNEVAKEYTTPPPAEGALQPSDIPALKQSIQTPAINTNTESAVKQ